MPDWADWFAGDLKTHGAIMLALGIGCEPVIVEDKKNSFSTGLAGESKAKRFDFPPPQVRSAGRASISQISSCRQSNS